VEYLIARNKFKVFHSYIKFEHDMGEEAHRCGKPREKSDTRRVTTTSVSLTNKHYIDNTTEKTTQPRCWLSEGSHSTRSRSYEGPEIASPNIETARQHIVEDGSAVGLCL
jgi:hypothetical protein